MDKSYFQGRKIHIKPAEKKPPKAEEPEWKPRDYEGEMRKKGEEFGAGSNYKKEKEAILKTNFDDETNWNYLFMN